MGILTGSLVDMPLRAYIMDSHSFPEQQVTEIKDGSNHWLRWTALWTASSPGPPFLALSLPGTSDLNQIQAHNRPHKWHQRKSVKMHFPLTLACNFLTLGLYVSTAMAIISLASKNTISQSDSLRKHPWHLPSCFQKAYFATLLWRQKKRRVLIPSKKLQEAKGQIILLGK